MKLLDLLVKFQKKKIFLNKEYNELNPEINRTLGFWKLFSFVPIENYGVTYKHHPKNSTNYLQQYQQRLQHHFLLVL